MTLTSHRTPTKCPGCDQEVLPVQTDGPPHCPDCGYEFRE